MLVGAVVAVSLWEPDDLAQAVAKMALQDVLRFAWFGYMAFTAAEGLMALAIAVGSGAGVAIAVALLPTIDVHAHAAVTGQRPAWR